MKVVTFRFKDGTTQKVTVPDHIVTAAQAGSAEAKAQIRYAAEKQRSGGLPITPSTPTGSAQSPYPSADDLMRPILCPVCRNEYTIGTITPHVNECHRKHLEHLYGAPDQKPPDAPPKRRITNDQ